VAEYAADGLDALLGDQLAYYRARAGEYDRVYEESDELASRARMVDQLPVGGDVLELACGTGQWTTLLAGRARTLTAVDAAPEMLAIARQRLAGSGSDADTGGRDRAHVELVQADLFRWKPPGRYDTVFFAFWLSHVPPDYFARFWETVRGALRPGGRAVFVDEGPAKRGLEEELTGQPAPAVARTLDDGSRHRVVKLFHDPDELALALSVLGWSADVRSFAGSFLIGVAVPRAAGPSQPG
jgi:SAM-dependent methyltransferase